MRTDAQNGIQTEGSRRISGAYARGACIMLNLKEFGEVFDFGMPQAPRNVGSVEGAIGDDPAGRWGPDLGVWTRACAQSMYTGHVTGEERCHVQAG